ncbi:hypothetical protein [Hyperthermus butylicus]|uniref:hypothetical protein n=1 Tax=Hyperthermus butylicus TaxID=54248 RepID=UPI00129A86BC|nr:hypothetical protein [Hyperthermus butylicus]
MAVAMYRDASLDIALVITDELYGEQWRFWSDDNRMAEVEKEYYTSPNRCSR